MKKFFLVFVSFFLINNSLLISKAFCQERFEIEKIDSKIKIEFFEPKKTISIIVESEKDSLKDDVKKLKKEIKRFLNSE